MDDEDEFKLTNEGREQQALFNEEHPHGWDDSGATAMWLGASPGGTALRLYFVLADGQEVKISIAMAPTDGYVDIGHFKNSLLVAVATAMERVEVNPMAREH